MLHWVPVASALGAGSVIGGWYGSSRARREARSGILTAIGETETTRWALLADSGDYMGFKLAVRDLETSALIARIPRRAVRHYVVLAETARNLSDDAFDVQYPEEDLSGPIDGYFDDLVRDAAELLCRLAWRPWWTRCVLWLELKSLRSRASKFDEPDIKRRLATGQSRHGVLPGPLSKLPGIKLPPPHA